MEQLYHVPSTTNYIKTLQNYRVHAVIAHLISTSLSSQYCILAHQSA